VEVPYKGSAPGVTDLLGGNVQFMFNALPRCSSTSTRASCARSAPRARSARPSFPTCPTIKDAVPGYEVTTWYSFVTAAGTPKAAIDRLSKEMAAIVDTPAVQEKLRGQDSSPTR